MTRAEDPRPARTRAAIEAAVEALNERGEEITVQAIVAESGVSRSTFYAHYRDLDALAIAILTDVFTRIEILDLELRQRATPIATARATTSQLVTEFARKRSLYAGVLGSRTTAEAHRAVHDAFVAQALGTMRATAPDGIDPRAAAIYVSGGSLAIITDWLLNDTPSAPERVQEQLLAFLPDWLTRTDDLSDENSVGCEDLLIEEEKEENSS